MKRWDVIANLVDDNEYSKGAEVGVAYGQNLFGVLERCPQLHMIAVDMWHPVEDVSDKGPKGLFGYPLLPHQRNRQRVMDRAAAYKDRLQIYEMESVRAAELILDKSLDFVFIDACHAQKEVEEDINAWKTKVREGGVVMGHDIHYPTVHAAVMSVLGVYTEMPDNCWCYYA